MKLMRKVEIEQTQYGFLLTMFTCTPTSYWTGRVKPAGPGPADQYYQTYEEAAKDAAVFMSVIPDEHAYRLTRDGLANADLVNLVE